MGNQTTEIGPLFTFLTFAIHYMVAHMHDNFIGVLEAIGTSVAQYLRCCATNRKVAGSIPGGVIGIFH